MEIETKKRSFETFGLLAGGLAHDYNNMLTAMIGGIDLILCDDIPESAREAATDVKATMLKAATLVRRMLSCATGAEAQPEPLDLGVAVGDIVRIMRRAIPDNAVVNLTVRNPLPQVMADAAMVWQAVMNLVTNACDALEGADGMITLEVRKVAEDAESIARFASGAQLSPGTYVEVAVSDTGCGMDAETLARIYEPLFTTKRNGNGLGLPSAVSVMATFGGGVKVESERGKGTTFTLAFPAIAGSEAAMEDAPGNGAAPKAAAAPRAGQAAPALGGGPGQAAAPAIPRAAARPAVAPGERPTILVVDDDASIVKLVRIILEKGGYRVVTASNGEEGLVTYGANVGEISMCLIDASMGAGMNGLDLCAAIRAANDTIPLILMSAYRAKEMNDRMAASGVTTFLAKPFRGGDVLALCAKYAGTPEPQR